MLNFPSLRFNMKIEQFGADKSEVSEFKANFSKKNLLFFLPTVIFLLTFSNGIMLFTRLNIAQVNLLNKSFVKICLLYEVNVDNTKSLNAKF